MAKKLEVYKRLREKGMTYDEIGEVFGITKQAVHDTLSHQRDGFREKTILKIKYVGLRNWMLENRITITELEHRCGRRITSLTHDHYDLSKKNIDAILSVTGLTYEECFKEE